MICKAVCRDGAHYLAQVSLEYAQDMEPDADAEATRDLAQKLVEGAVDLLADGYCPPWLEGAASDA